jgi:hypothetical protein
MVHVYMLFVLQALLNPKCNCVLCNGRCWTFPMYDVPHLSLKLSQSADTVGLQADLIAKDDLMYAQVLALLYVKAYVYMYI